MTKTKITTLRELTWQTSNTPKTGRIARVCDEGCGYWVTLPDGMTLADAADDFGLTYDHSDYVGEISCRAQLFLNGAEVEVLKFTLDNREQRQKPRPDATQRKNDK